MFRDVLWDRELDEDAVDGRIVVEFGNALKELSFGDILGILV
jgi:hypothetical protein